MKKNEISKNVYIELEIKELEQKIQEMKKEELEKEFAQLEFYCKECGERLKIQDKNCPKCGKKVEEN